MSHFSSLFDCAALSDFVGDFSSVGFSGSRLVGSVGYVGAELVLPCLADYVGAVGVGCARGVDGLVRDQFSGAEVFRVERPLSRAAFALRSVRLVEWVVSRSGLLVVFPSVVCPSGVRAGRSFRGFGSGSWGSAALGVGLGCSVLVFVGEEFGDGFPGPVGLGERFSLLGCGFGGRWWYSGS